MKHLAEARAGDLDHQRGRAWPALIRQRPLGMAERGAAPHAEPAVEPRLAGQPLQRLDAILALMTQRIERAARFEAPARSLHHDDVSPARPEPANGVGRKTVPEGAARSSDWAVGYTVGGRMTVWRLVEAPDLAVLLPQHRIQLPIAATSIRGGLAAAHGHE